MNFPLVSILTPAYNCEKYITEAIRAILSQSFSDFEYIIINDGSTDGTRNKVLEFNDPRIRFFENEKNLGIVRTLNRGLSLAKGKYILRTDADDVAMKDMAKDLVEFMESRPGYIICGGNMQLIGGDRIFTYPAGNDAAKIFTLTGCPFSHSTVIFRKQVLEDHNLQYDESIKDGEDHALWSALLPYGKFNNLEKVTLWYRESPQQVTAQKNYLVNYVNARRRIFSAHAKNYFGLGGDDIERYLQLLSGEKSSSLDELERTGSIISRIGEANKNNRYFDQQLLNHLLFIKWHWLCANSYYLGKKVFSIYIKFLHTGRRLSRIKSLSVHFIKMLQA